MLVGACGLLLSGAALAQQVLAETRAQTECVVDRVADHKTTATLLDQQHPAL